jgi:hypothetical protein
MLVGHNGHFSFWNALPLVEERFHYYGAFTLDVKSVLNENLGGILDGTEC